MLQFNSKYSGQYYQMPGGEVFTRTSEGVYKYAGAYTNSTAVVQLTGSFEVSARGNTMYQTTSGGWINLSSGWQYQAYAPIRMYSAKDAQYYVNRLIKNNARILENNLLCARFADKLDAAQRDTLRELQSRLEMRNEALLSDGLVEDQKVSTPPGYSDWSLYLQNFMNTIEGVGAIVSTSTIVVVAIVVASLATAAYFAYRALYQESAEDVKYSDELTKTLMEKLTPEEYQQLMEETQGVVTKAKLNAKFGGALSILKWGLLAVAGYVVYDYFKKGNKIWQS